MENAFIILFVGCLNDVVPCISFINLVEKLLLVNSSLNNKYTKNSIYILHKSDCEVVILLFDVTYYKLLQEY